MSTDIDRVHQRIDELGREVQENAREVTKTVLELTGEVRKSIALCGVCRPIVLGNGGEPLDRRVTILEEHRRGQEGHSVRFWTILGVVAAIIGTLLALPGLIALGR